MMWNYPYGMYYGWGVIGGILQLIFWVVIIAIVFRFVRGPRSRRWGDYWGSNSAEQILKERYAKGEISREEYEERLKVIRGQ